MSMKRELPLLLMLMVSMPSLSSDKSGKFAVKGVGGSTCQQYVAAIKQKSPRVNSYSGWVNGYMSSYNQLSPDTFDTQFWENNRLLMSVLENNCKKNPKQLFYVGVISLAKSMSANRIRKLSPTVTSKAGDRSYSMYRETLRRVQQVLAKQGLYRGKLDGMWGPGTKKAITDYQTKEKLQLTGIPDQATLIRLFAE